MRQGPESFFRSFFDRLRRSDVWRAVGTLAAGTVLARGLVILVSPVLTRLYTPEEFGVLGVYISVVSILAAAAALRYDVAIPIPASDSVGFDLLRLSLGLVVGTALVSGLVLNLADASALARLGLDAIMPYGYLVALGVLAAGVFNVLSYWAVRARAYAKLARTKISQGIGLAAVQVGLGTLGAGPIGLLAGDIVGRSSGSATLAALTLRDTRGFSRASWSRLTSAAASYKQFPIYSMPSSTLSSLGLYAPALIIAGNYGTVEAGYFALAQRVAGVGIALLGHAVGQAYMGEASRLVRERSIRLRSLYRSLAFRLFGLGLVLFVPLAAVAPWLFGVVFGLDWVPAGDLVRALAVFLLFQLATSPLSQTLNMMERQREYLIWEGLRAGLGVGTLFAAATTGASLPIAIFTYACGTALAYAVLLFYTDRTISTSYGPK